MTAAAPYLLGLAAAVSTYAGGRIAMRFGGCPDLLFGLTGGLVVGLALLDLLPEAVRGGGSAIDLVFGAVALGMACYILLHRLPGGGVAAARRSHRVDIACRMDRGLQRQPPPFRAQNAFTA